MTCKYVIFVVALLILLAGCTVESGSLPTPSVIQVPGKTPSLVSITSSPSIEASEPTSTQTPNTPNPTHTSTPSPTVEVITYTEEEVRKQQKAADQGHFPLRISDPVATALSYLDAHYDLGKVTKKPQVLKQKDNVVAVVEFESEGKIYRVTLEKLGRQDETGVWFVTRIEMTGGSVPPTAPISESPSVPTPAVGNEAKETPVTITGTVKDVSFSAHTIMLREPMQGFSILAVTQDTKLVSAEGLDITLREVRPGMVIQATGRPGTHGALLPDQVGILP